MSDSLKNLPARVRRSPMAWFASNHVAANLTMIIVIVGGLLSLARIKIEFFPDLDINWIVVTVPYPGATPEEVETGIVQTIEESVREVDFVEQVRSISAEAVATVMIEFEQNADIDKALDDVKQAIDRITTLPDESEEPIINQASNRTQVLLLAIYGDMPRRSLKELAERVRDDLTNGDAERKVDAYLRANGLVSPAAKAKEKVRPPKGISLVSITGLADYELSIEVSEDALRRHGLSFDHVAAAVRGSSLDLSAGLVKDPNGEILIRTTGQYYTAADFEQVVVYTRPDGTNIKLADVATVIDGFADTDDFYYFDGKPAVALQVYRVGEQDTLEIAQTVEHYIEAMKGELPAAVSMAMINDQSVLLKGRINLLLRNAAIGLLLVFLVLACFLDLRLAFWTMLGIPMSFLGAFLLLPQFDVSVNMISLFAFIVVLGIVVDDAIVVGENIFAYRQVPGTTGLEASIRGAREMFGPVCMAIATTVVAFLPLVLGEGTWFQILRNVPIVVISVLLISLVEAFVVLPSHLAGGKLTPKTGPIGRFQAFIRRRLEWVIDKSYLPSLRWSLRNRYISAALGLAVLILTGGLLGGGHLKTEFFPSIEADNMLAAVTMPQGTPAAQTRRIIERIERAGMQVIDEYSPQLKPGVGPLMKHTTTVIGSHPLSGEMTSRGGGAPESRSGGHLAEVNIELLEGERRGISSEKMVARWRELVGEVPGATSVAFTARFMAADAISVELAHADEAALVRAAEQLTEKLTTYAGVADITDNYVRGKRQIEVVALTPRGEALGVRKQDVARQLRSAFYGAEAQRIQRGRDEVKVMVRYTADERSTLATLDAMRVRLTDGTEAPLLDVVELRYSRDNALIYRTDQRRTVAILADIDKAVANAEEINADLRQNVLPALIDEHPGLSWTMEGEQKEKNQAVASMQTNFIIALLAIFALLAVQFRSYVQPIIVMTAIPFGLVGAVLGHMAMGVLKLFIDGRLIERIGELGPASAIYEAASTGMPLSFMSFFGVVALTGVVVNDSLIMIDLINRRRAEGKTQLEDALLESGSRRFRPILLTTLTTFFGLLPMILERSLQAQFLIPMAVSLGFGVLFATAITLIIVPTAYRILEDLRAMALGPDRADQWFTDPHAHTGAPPVTTDP